MCFYHFTLQHSFKYSQTHNIPQAFTKNLYFCLSHLAKLIVIFWTTIHTIVISSHHHPPPSYIISYRSIFLHLSLFYLCFHFHFILNLNGIVSNLSLVKKLVVSKRLLKTLLVELDDSYWQTRAPHYIT